MSGLEQLSRYLSYSRTRKGMSVACLIACVGLIVTFIEVPIVDNKQTRSLPLFLPETTMTIRGVCLSYIIFLGFVNYSTPYITATTKPFKCLKCEADMETTDLKCQNCGSTFTFKLR